MPSVPYMASSFLFTKRHPKLESNICASLPKGFDALEITQGPRVMFSTPPANITSASPNCMTRLALMIADIPEAHKRFTVSPGTVYGRPARSKDIRATFRLSSPA